MSNRDSRNEGSAPRRRMRIWLWIAGAAAIVFLLSLVGLSPEAMNAGQPWARTVYYAMLIALVGSSVILHYRGRLFHAARDFAIWMFIGALIVLCYSFRFELERAYDRITLELFPREGLATEESVSFVSSRGDQFIVDAEVDGVGISFLLDTGASDVVLTMVDARRLGIDPDSLEFSRAYRTANGIVYGAPVTLARIEIGPIRLYDVRASVNGSAMERSLLGMTFLSRLGGYEVSDGRLTLWP